MLDAIRAWCAAGRTVIVLAAVIVELRLLSRRGSYDHRS